MQYNITKIPTLLVGYNIPSLVTVDEQINPVQGLIVLCRVKTTKDRMNVLEGPNPGDFTTISENDIFPVILGKRCATHGCSGDVPTKLFPGDTIELLGESGFGGVLEGVNEDYGYPPTLTVLGTIPGTDGQPFMMKATVPPLPPGDEVPRLAPLIGVAGTCMEVGKTGMVCQLVRQLTAKGLRVAACKVTGSGSPRDKPRLRQEGADPVFGIVDAGIPSTCGDVDEVISSALRLLLAASQSNPDVIIVEFGDGILGGYHVKDVLTCEAIQRHMLALIVAVSDFVAAWGAKELLGQIGMEVSVITGVGVNSVSAQRFIEKEMGVLAESNRSEIPRTMELIKSKLRSNSGTFGFHLRVAVLIMSGERSASRKPIACGRYSNSSALENPLSSSKYGPYSPKVRNNTLLTYPMSMKSNVRLRLAAISAEITAIIGVVWVFV
ncbi:hypothetical protein P170DRAFT_465062 [Aspergillus steynii IBT 23096]|uniref:Uncharacterized protein n=1 Tax=Aspergillus steynii IBT 23096 TaxID=1392250 RepID=A0A2I2GA31_9EURO|nr:uncharacterized protein P170DRAFT_465062 [Aspergillus steynii IBT 23096]PLB49734.1 hypothetical protein P170DRAFT_465062 [Aspergillus steynii IBT 23096]